MDTQKERARSSAGDRALERLSNDDTAPISLGAVDVKTAILLEDIGASLGPIELQLACLAAHVAAGDSAGAVYSLKRLKAIWYSLYLAARDLIAADAERLSAIRQQAGGES